MNIPSLHANEIWISCAIKISHDIRISEYLHQILWFITVVQKIYTIFKRNEDRSKQKTNGVDNNKQPFRHSKGKPADGSPDPDLPTSYPLPVCLPAPLTFYLHRLPGRAMMLVSPRALSCLPRLLRRLYLFIFIF